MFNTLYVSHSKRGANHYYLDASARYRCIFPCEFIEPEQNKHCIHFEQIGRVDLSQYQRVIFHRPSISRKLHCVLKKLQKLNVQAIADFDDLLFSPLHALENPTYLSGKMNAKQALRCADEYLKALRLFKYAQASTAPLAKHIGRAHPSCHVEIQVNKMPQRWSEATDIVDTSQRLKNKIIRYFPGTSHHTSNFNSTIETLKILLKNNNDISLEVIGDIQVPSGTFPANQFKQLPPCLYEDLPKIIASSWLTISPLEKNEFNQCKSGLKFWESACFGVPVISNPIPDMERFHCKGLLLSNHHEDWLANINRLTNSSHYEIACDSALKMAQACSYKNTSKQQVDYASIQILMSAELDPSWPAIRVNPTHGQFTHSNRLHESLLQMPQSKLKEKVNTSDALSKSAMNATTYLASIKKSTAKRKLNKLKNNPKLFFRDMINKYI